MAELRLMFKDENVGVRLQRSFARQGLRTQQALGSTAREAAFQVEQFGRQDIQLAGRFGSRWTAGFHARPLLRGPDYVIKATSDIPYFNIFEYGGVIHGKPLLWIPLDFATDAKGIMARDYPGGLFRVDRKSGAAPLLLSITTGEPKYFGKEQVTMPKKFHIRQIMRRVARDLRTIYRKAFTDAG